MLSCVIATRLPMNSEKMAISASGKYQRLEIEGKVAMKMRPIAANAAALVATDMKQDVAGGGRGRGGRNRAQRRTAGGAVNEGHAVEQKARGEATEQQVFE